MDINDLHARMDKLEQTAHDRMEKIESKIDDVVSSLDKYKGMWGAISMILTAVWAAVMLLKDYVLAKFGHG